jgi:hypothetical protein
MFETCDPLLMLAHSDFHSGSQPLQAITFESAQYLLVPVIVDVDAALPCTVPTSALKHFASDCVKSANVAIDAR